MNRRLHCCAVLSLLCTAVRAAESSDFKKFNPKQDLLSLHYDHAPDRDDGQSAAADRTLLESLYGAEWLSKHVIAVSGAYGKNRNEFNPQSDAVMDATWNVQGGWIAADRDWDAAVGAVLKRWVTTLDAGGDVYVKEGGQSDLTAEVVKRLREKHPNVDPRHRIHVVQHADWNENQTSPTALAYTKANTDYVRIRDANAYLNRQGGDEVFEKAAIKHPVFGGAWKAAFAYYPPSERLDFSDTGELMHILGVGELSIEEFRSRFLEEKDSETPHKPDAVDGE